MPTIPTRNDQRRAIFAFLALLAAGAAVAAREPWFGFSATAFAVSFIACGGASTRATFVLSAGVVAAVAIPTAVCALVGAW